MRALETSLIAAAVTFIGLGIYLIITGESADVPPKQTPRAPTVSVGPYTGEPALTHIKEGVESARTN